MPRWTIRLALKADQDMAEIIAWTAEHFGSRQAMMYAETLTLALEVLFDGPGIIARRRDDIQPGVSLLHVAHQGRSGRHFIVFRPGKGRVIDVLRILHDSSMDISRHLLSPLMPYPAWPNEGLWDHVQRIEGILALRDEIEKCTARLRKESQFNRKVPINAMLRSLKQELSVLTSALKGPEGSRMMEQQ